MWLFSCQAKEGKNKGSDKLWLEIHTYFDPGSATLNTMKLCLLLRKYANSNDSKDIFVYGFANFIGKPVATSQ